MSYNNPSQTFVHPCAQITAADNCPACNYYPSYTGGHCFRCGKSRSPSKKNEEAHGSDLVDHFNQTIGWRIAKDIAHTKDRNGVLYYE